MKKYIISVMFLLISYVLLAQEEITMVVLKYDNNTIEQVGYLDQNGKKDSVWTQYNESGKVIGEGSYSHGVKNGRKIFEVLYINGEKRKGKQWDDEGHLIDKRKW